MPWYSIVAILTAIVGLITYTPQALKVHRTKQTAGLSPYSYLIVVIGVSLIVIYSSFLSNTVGASSALPGVISNTISSVFISTILYYISKNTKKMYLFWSGFAMVVSTIIISTIIMTTKANLPGMSLTVIITASVLLSSAFAPQTIKLIKSKDTTHVSLLTPLLIVLVSTLSIAFYVGIYIDKTSSNKVHGLAEIAGIISAIIGIGWQLPIIYLKLRHKPV